MPMQAKRKRNMLDKEVNRAVMYSAANQQLEELVDKRDMLSSERTNIKNSEDVRELYYIYHWIFTWTICYSY